MSARNGVIPPPEIAREAKRGLELQEKFHRCGKPESLKRARQLAERQPVSFRDIVAMSDFFARHSVEKTRPNDWGDEENPSAGHIAWLLWGGDPGKAWADEVKARADQSPGK